MLIGLLLWCLRVCRNNTVPTALRGDDLLPEYEAVDGYSLPDGPDRGDGDRV